MNLLILAAGASNDFDEAVYHYPKSLIEAGGIPVLEHVAQSLREIEGVARTIVVVRGSDQGRFHVGDVARLVFPNAIVLDSPDGTRGAACTALLAVDFVNNDEPLLISAGDQLVENKLSAALEHFRKPHNDGGVITFKATHPRWSFVRLDSSGIVQEAAEKRPISNNATAGVYYFARGADFVFAAMESIRKTDSVNGNYFIAPVYNQLVLHDRSIASFEIPRSCYWHLGSPQGIDDYARHLQDIRRDT